MDNCSVEVVLFDYGGVLAEEGFTAGLKAIGLANHHDPDGFFHDATEIIYECGYVTGRATAADFWNGIRGQYNITADDDSLTREIHSRFILRPGMMELVKQLKRSGVQTAILSDQTNWLYMLDERDDFLKEFSPVLNSYDLGTTKRDPEIFTMAQNQLKTTADRILFVDDNAGHIQRAEEKGFQVHLFQNEENFSRDISGRRLLKTDSGENQDA